MAILRSRPTRFRVRWADPQSATPTCPCHDPVVFGHTTSSCGRHETQPNNEPPAPPSNVQYLMTESGAHVEISHATWDAAINSTTRQITAAFGVPPPSCPPRHG